MGMYEIAINLDILATQIRTTEHLNIIINGCLNKKLREITSEGYLFYYCEIKFFSMSAIRAYKRYRQNKKFLIK